MNPDSSARGERLLTQLAGAGAMAGLLLAIALFLMLEEFRWGALALALSTALTGALALLCLRSARTSASSQGQGALDPESGLPVHPATGLYKSWVFHERLSEELARAGRQQRGLGVLLLEPANLLQEPTPEAYALAAKALRRALRTSDFAAQHDEERFVVLLPETDREGAQVAGRRLLSSLRSPKKSRTRWRAALVTYPEDGADADALLEHAQNLLRPGRLESALQSGSSDAA